MTGRFLLSALIGLVSGLAFAESLPEAIDLPEAPPELEATIREQDAALTKLEQQDAAARAALREWYASSLEAMRVEAINQGDLDRVLALDLDRSRVESDISPEEKARLFYSLRELRGRYDRRRADLMRNASSAARAGLQRYAVALDHLAGVFAQNGNAAAAGVVTRARLSMLGAAPTTAVGCLPGYPSIGEALPPGPSIPPAPSAASRGGSSGGGAWGSAAATVQGSAQATGSSNGAAANGSGWQSASAGNGSGSAGSGAGWGSSKPAAANNSSARAATSLSAPASVPAAKQAVGNLASQVSRRSAPASRPAAARPSGSGWGGGAAAGTGVWGR